MRVALDTNLLVYAEGVDSDSRRGAALGVLERLPDDAPVVPVQVLGELFNVLVRKGRRSREEARAAVMVWSGSYPLIATTDKVLTAGIELAQKHRLFVWDAVILSAAAESGCRLLLSEDMHDGFAWSGVTIVNPFAPDPHPLLERLLSGRK